MAKEEQKKNKNGQKKSSTKKNTTKKVVDKKVATNEVVKEVTVVTETKKEKKKGNSKFKNLMNKLMENTPFVISLCIIIVLLATIIFLICKRVVPSTKDGEKVIASVDGKKFTTDDLYQDLKKDYGTDVLLDLIDTYISEKEVKITDDDKKEVQNIVDYYVEYAESNSMSLKDLLANYGLSISTEDELFDYLMKDYKKYLAVVNYVGGTLSDDEIKTYYKENYSDTLKVKHILISIKDSEDEETVKKAKKQAEDLIKKLKKASKEDLSDTFDDLAYDYSDDAATYENGGLMEDVTSSNSESDFWKAASSLKKGKFTTEPVLCSDGYHIILKVDSTPVKALKEIKDEVKKAAAEAKLNSDANLQVSAWDELRNKYNLKINDSDVKKIYDKTIESYKKSEK